MSDYIGGNIAHIQVDKYESISYDMAVTMIISTYCKQEVDRINSVHLDLYQNLIDSNILILLYYNRRWLK